MKKTWALRIVGMFCFSALFLLLSNVVVAQPLHFVDEKSTVRFHIRNLGFSVRGMVNGLKGEVLIAKNPRTENYFFASLRAASVNTGIALRDRHLREEAYFNVIDYPEIMIRSKSISPNGASWIAVAFITIKGITREISFPFELTETSGALVFNGKFVLNRRDFAVGGRSISLSDEVEVEFSVTCVR